MEIGKIKITKKEARYILPDQVCDLVETPGHHVYAARDGGVVPALVIVATTDLKKSPYMIKYIHMDMDTGAEPLNRLLAHIEDVCKKEGTDRLACRIRGTDYELRGIKAVLTKRHYILLTPDGHYLMYYVADVRDCAIIEKLHTLKDMDDRVTTRDELTGAQLSRFYERTKTRSHMKGLELPGTRLSRIYVSGDDVLGYILVEEHEGRMIYLKDTYIERDRRTIFAMPYMLSSLLEEVVDTFEDDAAFILQVFDENIYNGIVNVFGQGETDERIHECLKIIR